MGLPHGRCVEIYREVFWYLQYPLQLIQQVQLLVTPPVRRQSRIVPLELVGNNPHLNIATRSRKMRLGPLLVVALKLHVAPFVVVGGKKDRYQEVRMLSTG